MPKLVCDPPATIANVTITTISTITTTASAYGKHVFASGTKIPVAVLINDGATHMLHRLDPEISVREVETVLPSDSLDLLIINNIFE